MWKIKINDLECNKRPFPVSYFKKVVNKEVYWATKKLFMLSEYRQRQCYILEP